MISMKLVISCWFDNDIDHENFNFEAIMISAHNIFTFYFYLSEFLGSCIVHIISVLVW